MQRAEPYFQNVLVTLALLLFFSCASSDDSADHSVLPVKNFPDRTGDFSLWQLASFNEEVQMGYILRTDDKQIIVIDGGGVTTANIVQGYLQQFGGNVNTWIVTHPHLDHSGVLMELIKMGRIKINRILHSELNLDWVQQHEADSYELVRRYNDLLKSSGIPILDASSGDVLSLGEGVELMVLGVRNEDIVRNAINNSSLVFKISSSSKSVLFLGDLGVEGGMALLDHGNYAQLNAQYVQMAHHGQTGVDRNFYEAVGAHFALWPTPKWLWNNQLAGKDINSGTWKTLEVRQWMVELGIKKSYVSGLDGNIQID